MVRLVDVLGNWEFFGWGDEVVEVRLVGGRNLRRLWRTRSCQKCTELKPTNQLYLIAAVSRGVTRKRAWFDLSAATLRSFP